MAEPQPECEFEAGDIIFYKPEAETFDELRVSDFSEFPNLGGYSQTLPYVHWAGSPASQDPCRYKPWHHIEAIVSCDGDHGLEVRGFRNDDLYTNTASMDAVISGEPLTPQRSADLQEAIKAGTAVVVRCPQDQRESFDDALKSHCPDDRPYSYVGLLGFAWATEMRILPSGPLRDDAERKAHAAEQYAKELNGQAQTCTTGISLALCEIFSHYEARLREPDAPLAITEPLDGRAEMRRIAGILEPMVGSNRQLEGNSAAVTALLNDLHQDAAQIRARQEQVRELWEAGIYSQEWWNPDELSPESLFPIPIGDIGEFPPPIDPDGPDGDPLASPGPFVYAAQYRWVLTELVGEHLWNIDVDSVKVPDHVECGSLLISPAILWDAMADVGFSVVCRHMMPQCQPRADSQS